jgi:hypothetical protein
MGMVFSSEIKWIIFQILSLGGPLARRKNVLIYEELTSRFEICVRLLLRVVRLNSFLNVPVSKPVTRNREMLHGAKWCGLMSSWSRDSTSQLHKQAVW